MSGTLIRSTARPRPPGATVPRPVHGTAFPACSAGAGAPNITVPGYSRPLLSSVPYNHIANGQFVAVADQLGNPPVQPGDALMLMSGNYGDIGIGDFNLPTTNSDFVTVEAAPGQTPVFTTLLFNRTSKWVFNAIKVQSLLGTNGNTQAARRADGPGRHRFRRPTSFWRTCKSARPTIRLAGARPSGSRRPAAKVLRRLAWPAMARTGSQTRRCISLAGSHIQNVRVGAILAANNLLFTNNVIDHFGDDGIDYAANNLAITHNTIHDNLDIGDGNHEDAMQGQNGPLPPGVAFNAFSNILIDSNLIARQTDPQLAFPTYLQGIDAFDEDWTNITVTNNVIVTSACHGITFASIHNSLIANNTVVEDGLFPTPGCVAAINIGGATHQGPLAPTPSYETILRASSTSTLAIPALSRITMSSSAAARGRLSRGTSTGSYNFSANPAPI